MTKIKTKKLCKSILSLGLACVMLTAIVAVQPVYAQPQPECHEIGFAPFNMTNPDKRVEQPSIQP